MKATKITHKITQGVYILTTKGGGCLVDAVMRAGSKDDAPLVAVSVAKTNHSHKLLSSASTFALSVLGQDVDPELIQTFGFKSSRDVDKFTCCETAEISGIPVVKGTIGHMVLEKIDAIDNDTHTIFLGKLISGDLLEPDAEPMTYDYYQEHKSVLVAVSTERQKTAWVCTACGYVYYGDEVPDDFKCPLCGLGKAYFKKKTD